MPAKPVYVTKAHFDKTLAEQDQRNAVVWNALLDKIDQLSADLARHAKAIQESVSAQIKVVDEKYADLPGRVAALESRSAP